MIRVYEFLNNCQTYYLATIGLDNKPKLRPMGTILLNDNKLYFQTSKLKNVYAEMSKNPAIEICAYDGNTWLRLQASALLQNHLFLQTLMLDKYPNLKAIYQPGDEVTAVFQITKAQATLYTMGKAPQTINFS
ncbi:MAG: pyridoxamine 5'-phosphate oxidase family protein [Acholeplasmatales bacterium]|jgi:uncharacterized pyridoxamine 5'-phosphate oxidase family protein|nr:pyridoxamine 5'-phosphate oxidase family protein [Acholeplasmatales bacterium]